jgi:hypothetical protein
MSLYAEITEIMVAVQRIESSMIGRSEYDSDLSRRLSVETYISDQRGMNERLTRLESGPMRGLAWMGAATGCAGVMIACISVIVTVVALILSHH